jgi:hypothetical protein
MQRIDLFAGVVFLVIHVSINVNQLAALGREFLWPPKPPCPACNQPLWWHGFVLAYLACFAQAVFLRRLYCPHCGAVHRLRPDSHWRRFQSPIATIEEVIAHRQGRGRWRPDLPRPRQRQWWRRLRRKTSVCLGLCFAGTLLDAFAALVRVGVLPVSSVMQCGDPGG